MDNNTTSHRATRRTVRAFLRSALAIGASLRGPYLADGQEWMIEVPVTK